MLPLVLIIALSFFSFLASAFVVLRIVIPILPPHPLSRRVAPSEFGLPNYNFRSLSSADKSHLWLASLDLLALGVFTWQAVLGYYNGTTGLTDAWDTATSARLWFALTIRQSCLFVVSGLILVHIRMGRSVSFGWNHWMIWVPTLFLGFTSTTLASILSSAGAISGFFVSVAAYSITTAVLSTAAFGGLVYTLVAIKRNLAALNEPADNWPPAKEVEQKHRSSFATEDVDVLREGSSWLTSDADSSRHGSVISNWSFSTHHSSIRPSVAAPQPPLQSKSSFWFNPSAGTSTPPVPLLPSIYRGDNSKPDIENKHHDPFRRDVPSRPRFGSQSSWLTSPSVSQATMSAWSYPTNPAVSSTLSINAALLPHASPVLQSRLLTPGDSVVDINAALPAQEVPKRLVPATLSSAKVLGGYGYTTDNEKGIMSLAITGEVDVSYSKYVFWLLSIWVPLILSLPYLVSVGVHGSASMGAFTAMLVLSVTVSSPLLALNILVRSPIPIPAGIFGAHAEPPSVVMRAPSPAETLATYCRGYKGSGSATVVEGRPSGDVWLSQGDAVDGRGKLGRALGLITPLPRLAVLPLEEEKQDGEITPPLPMQEDTFHTTSVPTPQSADSIEQGRPRTRSKASSHFSSEEAFSTKIMIAQRHYSAVATTVVVPVSPRKAEYSDDLLTVATGVDVVPPTTHTTTSHLRSRSVSSIAGIAITTPDTCAPPSQPLPPTPPNIRNARQTARQLLHRKSHSSDFSFGAVVNDDVKEIDALTAGVLPLLVPGLRLGEELKIRDWEEFSPPLSSTVTKKKPSHIDQLKASVEFELGMLGKNDFTSPQMHSTPHGRQSEDRRKISKHKKNHFSLPSLGLDKDITHTWETDLNRELSSKIGQCASVPAGDHDVSRRITISSDEVVSSVVAHPRCVDRDQHAPKPVGSSSHSASTHHLGLRVEIPGGMNSARASLATLVPPSAASTTTLFETQSILEPDVKSTPGDNVEAYPYNRKHQDTAVVQTVSTCHSGVPYHKSDDKGTLRALAPSLVRKASTFMLKSSAPENKLPVQGGGLRPLTLLKGRDTRKDSGASKFSGTRPLSLGKKQKSKVVYDENTDPNSVSKQLRPLHLSHSESIKIRGMLRRDEALPTVIVRPPSTTTANSWSLHE